MTLLIDTQAFLWWVDDDKRLTRRARSAIGAARNTCFVSIATAWELAIKASIGKLKLRAAVLAYVEDHVANNRFDLLPIALSHVARVERLPRHHGDPFDRLLIAQALEEELAIVTSDAHFTPYPVKTVW
jgi:PIN domain nuclease of toxin-antitoxin system